MNLRARLLILVLLATLLPALLLSWHSKRDSDAEVNVAITRLASSANHIATELEHRVQGTAQLAYGLARSRVLDSADPTACSAYLANVLAAYPQYTGLLTVLPNGRLHCDSLQSGRQLDLNDRSYVKRVLAGATDVVLEPLFGRLTGNAVMQVVYPARNEDGSLRFMLVASLNLGPFAAEAQGQSLLTETELLLVNEQGVVLSWLGRRAGLPKPGSSMLDRPEFALAQRQADGGTHELQGPQGESTIWAVAASPTLRDAGLHLLLGQPRQALMADSTQRLRETLWAQGVTALLLFLGIWLLAEWGIRRQVGRITHMARALGEGELGVRIPQPHPGGELGGLMAVLNHTADSLQQQRLAIDELNQRLQEAHQREISERESNEARLLRMANFDGLTGLPNRHLFHDRLQQAMARSRRSGQPFALMFLDVDRFKYINDSLGHDIGDQLLVAVATQLSACLRDTDALGRPGLAEGNKEADGSASAAAAPRSGDVFRVGGDEFTVLAEELSDAAAAGAIAERILTALRRPLVIEGHELFISASIGITVHADDNTPGDALIKQADMAMYRAKERGRDTYAYFDEELNQAARQRHALEARLRHALERDEFLLHYQPKADMATGRITGVEALLRWQPPGEAMVRPDQFIPVLEETGLIVAVGDWVLRTACAQMMAWRSQGLRPLQLAVNLSPRQFRHQTLLASIEQVLADTELEPHRLEIELTESMLIDDSETVLDILRSLGAMGIRIAIDDFGTGHSSLSYLKRFDVDTLKIDRSFVKDTPHDAELSAIAVAVIGLGHGLRLSVVAEGVETQAQMDFLRQQGCDELQGYLLSRPASADDFARWFAQYEAAPSLAP